jgi:hypothetical protein
MSEPAKVLARYLVPQPETRYYGDNENEEHENLNHCSAPASWMFPHYLSNCAYLQLFRDRRSLCCSGHH